MTKRITILGSTGSIGDSTLDLVRRAPADELKVVALTANSNAEKLAEQAIEFDADYVALASDENEDQLRQALSGRATEIGIGPEALIEAASRSADFCMAAIIGAAGLEPTLAAVDQGLNLGLANKECLVCAGDLFMRRVSEKGATLLPVDSEHNAIFQVLDKDKPEGIVRLILTASGGPFRETSSEKLKTVTRADALAHPVWDMGAKISIDSATLMNKGLELIEASYLFDRPSSEIDVVVHPQSIIHSMVEYVDGSILAQLGSPDMRTPIAYAMAWPDRMTAPVERLNLTQMGSLTFFEPDTVKFPALRLAREALEAGGKAPCILNAANEVAVAAFLEDKISFIDIPKIVEHVLDKHAGFSCFKTSPGAVEEFVATDRHARKTAHEHIVSL